MQRAKQNHLFEGISVGRNGVSLSHLQFADDTIVFSKAEIDNLRNIKRVLQCFKDISGLKVNFAKSVGVGVDANFLEQVKGIFGCRVQSLPLKCLGLPVGINPKSKKCWEPVLERVNKKLAVWKFEVFIFWW